MKRLLIVTLLLAASTFYGHAQDTLKRWDLFGEGVQAELETQTQPNPWGYRYGTGANGVYEFAEKYAVDKTHYLWGVVVLLDQFNGGVHTDDEAWAAIYGQQANGKIKDKPMLKSTMAMKDLKLGMDNPTIFMFPAGTQVSDSFFVSFGFPKYQFNVSSPNYVPPTDTVGIYTTYTRDNDKNPDVYWTNAIRYNGDNWENTFFIKGDRINFCIAPIISLDDQTSGISEVNIGGGINIKNVYPNPVVNYINLEVESAETTEFQIMFYDLNGRMLSQSTQAVGSGAQTLHVDVPATVPSGAFIALIKSPQGLISYRLMKQ